MRGTNFFGYETLEAWAEVAQRDEPVYATLVRERKVGATTGSESFRLMVAQPDAQGDVQYWQQVVGRLALLHGQPFGAPGEVETVRTRAASAWEVVRAWLVAQGFTVRDATVAVPTPLTLLDGSTAVLAYDEATNRFVAAAVG